MTPESNKCSHTDVLGQKSLFNFLVFDSVCSVVQVTDQSVRAVSEHCPELQFVGFMGCPVTSQGVIHLTAVGIAPVLDLHPNPSRVIGESKHLKVKIKCFL